MTLLEKIETALPIAERNLDRKKGVDENRFAFFDPLTLAELREVADALRTVAGQR